MRLVYQNSIPYEIKTVNKSLEIPLSNEIVDDFNHYYTYIVNFKSNNDYNKDTVIEELSKEYKHIALKIEGSIRQSGNMKARHTHYEMEFILACSYKLIEKFNFKQVDLAIVFSLKPNAFSELGVYPIRSYDAYNKLQTGYIWVMPTFNTGIAAGTYKAEPLIVVMKYQKYLESLLHTLAPDAWEAYISVHQVKDVANEFRNIFNLRGM